MAALLRRRCLVAPGVGDSRTSRRSPYPEVKVDSPRRLKRSILAFHRVLEGILRRGGEARNAEALFALVGPMFTWTAQGALVGEFDPGRDALHNFKVVFGFRQQGTRH